MKWQPTPAFLPEKSHGQGSLADYSPLGRKELDTAEQLTDTHTHTHIILLLGLGLLRQICGSVGLWVCGSARV